ncbi:16S rRNA (guanine(527)-N(7))-methyltransferase RsmG [Pengzhenrongella sp.]|uniref:16S rRNA (guanine(527)-N(7))-methyltransferase RsmG n=1 Tax=Pengzhenrongella sp. TaxID=2888820 RepID=UPI002F91DD68
METTPDGARGEQPQPDPIEPDPIDPDPIEPDPLENDERVATYLGAAYPILVHFHRLLTEQGVLRGLIGPREVSRLWERHLLNSAAVAQFLPTTGRLIDVGSGAGLPGVVLAAMLPEVEVILLEPMERRAEWLTEVVAELGLANAVVRRGRAEELHGELQAEAITARAVAPMDRLGRWTLPLLVKGGVLVALKGRQAPVEVAKARSALKKLGAGQVEILEALTIDGVESTTVVRVVRETVRGSSLSRAGAAQTAAPRRDREK